MPNDKLQRTPITMRRPPRRALGRRRTHHHRQRRTLLPRRPRQAPRRRLDRHRRHQRHVDLLQPDRARAHQLATLTRPTHHRKRCGVTQQRIASQIVCPHIIWQSTVDNRILAGLGVQRRSSARPVVSGQLDQWCPGRWRRSSDELGKRPAGHRRCRCLEQAVHSGAAEDCRTGRSSPSCSGPRRPSNSPRAHEKLDVRTRFPLAARKRRHLTRGDTDLLHPQTVRNHSTCPQFGGAKPHNGRSPYSPRNGVHTPKRGRLVLLSGRVASFGQDGL